MHPLPSILLILGLSSASAIAQAPTYQVEPIATFDTVTTVHAANEVGQIVGYQIVAGLQQPYVAAPTHGLTFLPLPAGFHSGSANDINGLGVIVGSAYGSGGPEPAVWTPNGSGGYVVTIPEQFQTLPSPLGDLPISGSVAVAISDNGTIVGTSIYQGFQGGPTTQFFLTGPPVNLGALGFSATVRAINNNDVIVGGGIRMDLGTGVVTDLGVPDPPSGLNYTHVIAYAVNDQNETVVAAQQATSATRWVTFIHDDTNGFTRHHPSAPGTPFVGQYDNNDLGDTIADTMTAVSSGVLFSAEGAFVSSFDGLLEPASAHWDTNLGKISNDRRVYTTARNTVTGSHAIVQLVPTHACNDPVSYCTSTIHSGGTSAVIGWFGSASVHTNDLMLQCSSAPANRLGIFFHGPNQVQVPFGDGFRCVGGATTRTSVVQTNAVGSVSLALDLATNPGITPGVTRNFQFWFRDPGGPGGSGFNLSDALEVTFCD